MRASLSRTIFPVWCDYQKIRCSVWETPRTLNVKCIRRMYFHLSATEPIIWLFVGKRCAPTLWDTAYLSRISLNGGPIFGAQTLVLPSSLITRITSNRLTVSCPDNMISFSAKCSHRMVLRRRICLARLLIRFRCGLLVFVSFDLHF